MKVGKSCTATAEFIVMLGRRPGISQSNTQRQRAVMYTTVVVPTYVKFPYCAAYQKRIYKLDKMKNEK